VTRQPRKHEFPPKSGRSVLIFIVSAAAVVALALGVRAAWPAKAAPAGDVVGAAVTSDINGTAGEDTISMGPPSPVATPAPKPSPVIAPPGVITKELATTMVTGFVASAAAPRSIDAPDQLSTVAKGAILAEIENMDEELASNGWTLSGKPVVKSVTIVSTNLTGAPPTALVQACIDSSKVATLDSSGRPVGKATDSPPALNLYSLQQDAGVWRVVARTFPNDPAC
jgi:hypothetical protein